MKPALLLAAGLTAGTILGHLAARASLRWICGHDLLEPDWRNQMLREVREG